MGTKYPNLYYSWRLMNHRAHGCASVVFGCGYGGGVRVEYPSAKLGFGMVVVRALIPPVWWGTKWGRREIVGRYSCYL